MDWLPTPVFLDFLCGSTGKESACNVGGLCSIPGLGKSPGEGKGYPLQYSDLENSMFCKVHGVAKSRTWLSDFNFHIPKEALTSIMEPLYLKSFHLHVSCCGQSNPFGFVLWLCSTQLTTIYQHDGYWFLLLVILPLLNFSLDSNSCCVLSIRWVVEWICNTLPQINELCNSKLMINSNIQIWK